MMKRIPPFLMATIAGIAVGLWGDHVAGGVEISTGRVAIAMLLSPVVVTVGGRAVDAPGLTIWFMMGGIAFWPGYLGLAWLWFRRGVPFLWILAFLWTCQGFFQLMHRLDQVMSV